MRKDLIALPWLTAEQSLVVLKDLLGYDISYNDLISQCEYHHCEVFILPGRFQGTSATALPVGEDDWTTTCCASGLQKVLNPEVLTEPEHEVKLCLWGAVLTLGEDEPRRHQPTEWEALVELDECRVRFQTSAIQGLADLITSLTKTMDPRERRSLHKVVKVLAAISGIDVSKPYAAHPVMEAAASLHGIEFELTAQTLKNHFEAVTATR